MRTDAAPIVVASSGSHKVVGPSTEEKRTMIKKLAVLCAGAIFVLVVGGAVTPVWAHADCGPGGKGKHSDTHPHCGVVNEGSTNDGSLY
jgi:hypothetical protein